MTTTDKLTTVAENVPKVYNAGLASLVNAMTNGGTDFTCAFARYFRGEYDEEGNPIQAPPLITIPQIDTSNGTNFRYMFYNCDSLIAIPQLDVSKGTNFTNMFYNCVSITSIPQLDTSKGTNFYGMFMSCINLTSIPQLDTSKGKDFSYMFSACKNITSIPSLDVSNGTTFNTMFHNCIKLTTIPQLDVSKGTNFNSMFGSSAPYGCVSLTTISFVENCIGANISFKFCEALSHDSLISILNGLKTVTSTKTCTLGATNIAKLTDEEKAIATQKNWTLAS